MKAALALLALSGALFSAIVRAEDVAEASDGSPDSVFLDQIEEAADAGRFVQVAAMLKRTPQQDTPRLAVIEAQLLAAAGRPEAALTALEKVEAAGYRSCRLSRLVGDLLDRGGKVEEAEPHLLNAVRQCPGTWQGWEALALHYDRRQQWARSGSAYETAFRLTDRPARIANNYGVSLLRQGRAKEAANLFAEAVSRDGSNPRYRNNEDSARAKAGLPLRDAVEPVGEDQALRLADAVRRAGQMQAFAAGIEEKKGEP
ncbi:tetratricopeptide repeat protein [Sphingobium baderi]|uniref:Uncharacterized protein n=1 Tax=Sphingobium baderi TaxID=1332080 RepID=A0A0S3EYD3_9SPHN|nr:tetratricopeptide repeat protein [Sphingobium baderi]ALR20432.1 hypothetical protein ATN00_09035 [Sphingobium baderi]